MAKSHKKLASKWSVKIAIAYILLSIFMAIFCYLIVPDNSSNANTTLPEIANLKPMSSVKLIKIPINPSPQNSFLHTLIFGKEQNFLYYPFDSILLESSTTIQYSVYSMGDTTLHDIQTLKYTNQTRVEKVRKTYIMGTDKLGRDIFSRLIIGSRVSLGVGIIAVLISLFIGTLVGCMAGYFGGKIDSLVLWGINVFWAIPTILLVFSIVIALGKSFWLIFIAIGITMWVGPARIIRGQVLSLKENNYIIAAKALGYSPMRIIIYHILPNLSSIIIVLAAANFATAILIEAGLSFLGVGIQAPMSSWGLMVKEHFNYLITDNPFPTLIPGIAIMLSVLSYNILGNALRDYFDIKD